MPPLLSCQQLPTSCCSPLLLAPSLPPACCLQLPPRVCLGCQRWPWGCARLVGAGEAEVSEGWGGRGTKRKRGWETPATGDRRPAPALLFAGQPAACCSTGPAIKTVQPPSSRGSTLSHCSAARPPCPPAPRFPWISYSDLWTLAGATAVEAMGGAAHQPPFAACQDLLMAGCLHQAISHDFAVNLCTCFMASAACCVHTFKRRAPPPCCWPHATCLRLFFTPQAPMCRGAPAAATTHWTSLWPTPMGGCLMVTRMPSMSATSSTGERVCVCGGVDVVWWCGEWSVG